MSENSNSSQREHVIRLCHTADNNFLVVSKVLGHIYSLTHEWKTFNKGFLTYTKKGWASSQIEQFLHWVWRWRIAIDFAFPCPVALIALENSGYLFFLTTWLLMYSCTQDDLLDFLNFSFAHCDIFFQTLRVTCILFLHTISPRIKHCTRSWE